MSACLGVIAGHDPSGGAGVAADRRAAAAMGADVRVAVTAWTEQTMDAGFGWRSNPSLAGELPSLRGCGAIKIGMVGTVENLRHIKALLQTMKGTPVVMDPVLASTSGLALWEAGPAELLELAPYIRLLTPNLPELAALTQSPQAPTAQRAIDQARLLLEAGIGAVLVKDGHGSGDPVDVLVTDGGVTEFSGSRVPGSFRGTGCWLASAIASLLAQGRDLASAVGAAREELERRLWQAYHDGIRYVP